MPRGDQSEPYFGLAAESAGRDPRGQVLMRRVPLTSEQILALDDTPVELVPAPGPGRQLVRLGLVLDYQPGETPYTVPEGCRFTAGYPDDLDPYADPLANFLALSDPRVCLAADGSADGDVWVADGALNAPLQLATSDALTDGDGTLAVTTVYMVI